MNSTFHQKLPERLRGLRPNVVMQVEEAANQRDLWRAVWYTPERFEIAVSTDEAITLMNLPPKE